MGMTEAGNVTREDEGIQERHAQGWWKLGMTWVGMRVTEGMNYMQVGNNG